MKPAYYNEHEPFAAEWLRRLIAAGHIPAGDVDDRDIRAVQPDDLAGYGQKHLFAGIAGWAYACRLAGFPDDADILTGSPPCQPFSVAGRQAGVADDRHLWPEMARLAASLRPAHVAVENVANVVGMALDGMLLDLETAGYCARAFVVPACAVDAPHRRDRVWIAAKAVGDAAGAGWGAERRAGQEVPEPGALERSAGRGGDGGGSVEHAAGVGRREGRAEHELRGGRPAAAGAGGAGALADADDAGRRGAAAGGHQRDRQEAGRLQGDGDARQRGGAGFWDDAGWIAGADGKARRVPLSPFRIMADGLSPGMAGVRASAPSEAWSHIPLLAQGVQDRVGKLKALGNSICPQVAAEILKAMRSA